MPLIRTNNLELQINAREDDTVRIANFLASGPGVTFAAKQALLRASIPATRLANPNSTPQERVQAGKEALAGAATAAAHIATILAQVPVNGTGTHFLYNELARLVAEPGQLYYAGTGNAANDALYKGAINIAVNSRKMKGASSFDDNKYGRSGESDDIGLLGLGEDITEALKKDLLPVVFRVVGEPNSIILFRGYIQGLTNSYNPSWTPVNYVGRGEPLYTFTNTSRTLAFGLQVPIFSKEEQHPVFQKINALTSYTYPKYVNNLPQGTVVGVRIGDYISQYGVITSLTDTVDTDVPWSSNEDDDTPVLLPQVVRLQLSMNVIHDRLPERFTKDSDADNLPFVGNGLPAFKDK